MPLVLNWGSWGRQSEGLQGIPEPAERFNLSSGSGVCPSGTPP